MVYLIASKEAVFLFVGGKSDLPGGMSDMPGGMSDLPIFLVLVPVCRMSQY